MDEDWVELTVKVHIKTWKRLEQYIAAAHVCDQIRGHLGHEFLAKLVKSHLQNPGQDIVCRLRREK